MDLYQLIKTIDVIDRKHMIDKIEINGIANHTDNVKEGYLYVAIKGYLTDGHKYIEKAIENGAVAAIVEDFRDELDIPQFKVKNPRIALSALSAAFYNYPSRDMRMIGVTATNGKTTTTYMLNKIFEVGKYKNGLIGSVMNKVGDEIIPSVLTTPESVDLQRYLFKMRENGVEKVAMESSSSALELYRVNDIDFDIVSFNNFSREHIDQHGTFEKYWEAKSSLIKNAKESAYAVLNLDDEYSSSLIDKTKAKVITYSLTKEEGNLYCKDLELLKGRARFTVRIKEPFKTIGGNLIKDDFEVILGIPGYHSVANAMAAITIALIDDIPCEIICEGLKKFSGVERRFQYIYENDFIIIDDHFANKGNINVTLETLKYMKYNKFRLVYAIRGNRGVTVNRENAETIGSWKDSLGIDEIIATKSIGDVGPKDTVTKEEEDVFLEVMESYNIKVDLYDTLDDAIKQSLKTAGKDDIVMLAGCQGMDHGARVALNIIREMKPELSDDYLFKSMKNRIV
ncbi:MAG: UDP-N-acetylmuramyl-tripeptide synthetase [Tissierellaceae bacterium]|nr:UDP-N-acetylmuramyl-tripeptide synthetase [Tissierellaceae bacterium]